MSDRTFADLQTMQRFPLEAKVYATQARIYDWIDKWGVDGLWHQTKTVSVCVTYLMN